MQNYTENANGVAHMFFHKRYFNRNIRLFEMLIFMIVYKKTEEWYIEWQRVTTNDSKWEQVVQRVITSDNDWYNEWQQVTKSDNELQ